MIRIGFAYLNTLCSTKIISKLWTDDKAFCSPSYRLYRYYTRSISIVYFWDGYRTPEISIRFLGFSLDFRDFQGILKISRISIGSSRFQGFSFGFPWIWDLWNPPFPPCFVVFCVSLLSRAEQVYTNISSFFS